MLQDDDSRLSRWLANRPGARYQVRKNVTEQQPDALRLADALETLSPLERDAAAELRRLHELYNALLDDYHGVMETLEEMQAAVAAEREACAKLCDSLEEQCEKLGLPDEKWPTPADCAAVIRART
jgi:glycine/D-amino acid oxidase-like deaminating enzyme